jgi:aconitate hydratase
MGDPRSFTRPVRVTIPRALPTDDVLVVRDRKQVDRAGSGEKKAAAFAPTSPTPWKGGQTLDLIEGPSHLGNGQVGQKAEGSGVAIVCSTLDEVREVAARATELAPSVRAVLAPFIPSGAVGLFSGLGIAAIRLDAAGLKGVKGQRQIQLPAPAQWNEKEPTVVAMGSQKVSLTWLALGPERAWASAGTSRPQGSRSRS